MDMKPIVVTVKRIIIVDPKAPDDERPEADVEAERQINNWGSTTATPIS
ncbi:hypothetical protein ABIF90_000163 [Bradyrhizobium japonicum]